MLRDENVGRLGGRRLSGLLHRWLADILHRYGLTLLRAHRHVRLLLGVRDALLRRHIAITSLRDDGDRTLGHALRLTQTIGMGGL